MFVWGALGNAEDNSRSFGLLDRFLWLKSKFIDLEDYSVVFNVMYMERERESRILEHLKDGNHQ